MIDISGYKIFNNIYESSNSMVYRGTRISDNKPVILKTTNAEYPTPEQLARFRREYEIICRLDIPGIVQAYHLESCKNRLMIVLEDFGGESLRKRVRDSRFFCRAGINIGSILIDGSISAKI